MSIKTFPGKSQSAFLIFLILSALMHMGIWGALRIFPSELRHQKKEASLPIPIEIIPAQPVPEQAIKNDRAKEESKPKKDISKPLAKNEVVVPKAYIKVPQADPRNIAPVKRPPTVFSDKTQSVLKETVPAQKMEDGKGTGTTGNSSSNKSLSGKTAGQSISKGDELKSVEPLKETDIPAKEGIGKSDRTTSSVPKIMKEGTKKPNLFPSDERIAELNRDYEVNPPKGEVGKKLQLNTSETRFKEYIAIFKIKTENVWRYPAIAIRNQWQGSGTIIIRINKDGTISKISFLKFSGYPVLDDAVLTAVRLSSPLPPLPKDVDLPYIDLVMDFECYL